MKTLDLHSLTEKLAKNKYVLLVAALGLLLIFLPGGSDDNSSVTATGQGSELESSGIPVDTESRRLAEFLSRIEGVGDCSVLLSANGAVVVCEGAEEARVKLCVTNAVSAYTGLSSDKISVIKMK